MDDLFSDGTVKAALIAMMTAVVTAIAWLSKRAVSGCTHYAGKLWGLLEVAAGKHFTFIDATVIEQGKQTVALEGLNEKIETKFGSDPFGKLNRMKEEFKRELVAEIQTAFPACSYDRAEMIVEEASKQQELKASSPSLGEAGDAPGR